MTLAAFLGHLMPTNLMDWYSGFAFGLAGALLNFGLAYRVVRFRIR